MSWDSDVCLLLLRGICRNKPSSIMSGVKQKSGLWSAAVAALAENQTLGPLRQNICIRPRVVQPS